MTTDEVLGISREAGAVPDGHFDPSLKSRRPVFRQKVRVFMHAGKYHVPACPAVAGTRRDCGGGRPHHLMGGVK